MKMKKPFIVFASRVTDSRTAPIRSRTELCQSGRRTVAQDIFLFQSDTIRIWELRSVDYGYTDLHFARPGGCLPLQVT